MRELTHLHKIPWFPQQNFAEEVFYALRSTTSTYKRANEGVGGIREAQTITTAHAIKSLLLCFMFVIFIAMRAFICLLMMFAVP